MAKNPFTISGSRGGQRTFRALPTLTVKDFKYGLVDYIDARQIPRGAASESLNWLTKVSQIEIRNGYNLLGTRVTGTGVVLGVFTAHKWDGSELLYKAIGTSLYLYDETLAIPDWVEIGTNILSGANGEDITFAEYFSPAGAQLWISSPSSDLIKIMTANPNSYATQYLSGTNFKGRIQIKNSRMFLWYYSNAGAITNIKGTSARNVLQLSYIDNQSYTTVTGEATASLSGTLAFKAGGARRTCFAVKITLTGTGEVYTDNYLGALSGSLGGTGTINYMTGDYTLSNSGTGTADYQWEDSTNHGIADFTRSATRTAGQGASFLQNEGGDLLNVFSYNNVEYCIHSRKAYAVTISTDDTLATNLIYRDRLGMANWKAGVATDEGIYYIDDTDKSNPFFGVIQFSPVSQQTLPKNISSEQLNLSNYSFDQSVGAYWNNYIIFTARTLGSSKNNRMFMYNRIFNTWDLVDFFGNNFAIHNGTLIAGDSVTNNAFTLFSGFDDDGNIPETSWVGNIDNYGIEGLKKTKQIWLEGNIEKNQSYDVEISVDSGQFTKVGTILGTGSYVDVGSNVAVGEQVVGLNIVGGGNVGNTIFANHYLTNIKLKLDKFMDIQIRFITKGIGFVSITGITHFDIRTHQQKLPIKYRS